MTTVAQLMGDAVGTLRLPWRRSAGPTGRLPRSMNASRWPYTQLALAGAAAVLVGAVLPNLPAALVVVALVAAIILTVVILHPPVAAYMLIGLTPLIAGINRGAFIALLRPSEALAVLLGLGLGIGGLLRM